MFSWWFVDYGVPRTDILPWPTLSLHAPNIYPSRVVELAPRCEKFHTLHDLFGSPEFRSVHLPWLAPLHLGARSLSLTTPSLHLFRPPFYGPHSYPSGPTHLLLPSILHLRLLTVIRFHPGQRAEIYIG